MSKLRAAAIRLYHIKEEAHTKNFLNAMVNNVEMDPEPKISGSRIWFWGIKRWGPAFSREEYIAREAKL